MTKKERKPAMTMAEALLGNRVSSIGELERLAGIEADRASRKAFWIHFDDQDALTVIKNGVQALYGLIQARLDAGEMSLIGG